MGQTKGDTVKPFDYWPAVTRTIKLATTGHAATRSSYVGHIKFGGRRLPRANFCTRRRRILKGTRRNPPTSGHGGLEQHHYNHYIWSDHGNFVFNSSSQVSTEVFLQTKARSTRTGASKTIGTQRQTLAPSCLCSLWWKKLDNCSNRLR